MFCYLISSLRGIKIKMNRPKKEQYSKSSKSAPVAAGNITVGLN
jgi:hypothetical protein